MSSMNTSCGRIPSHNDLPFTNRRQPLSIHITTSTVGLARVTLGTAQLPLNMHLKHDSLLHSGFANRNAIVDVGIAPFAGFDFVSYGLPLG